MKWMKTLGGCSNKSFTSPVIINGFSIAMLISEFYDVYCGVYLD